MRHHQQLFENVRLRPEMNLPDTRYHTAAAFVLGYDAACQGGLLEGFREWLLLRRGAISNRWWPALVLEEAFPSAPSPVDELSRDPRAERQAVEKLFALIREFDALRNEREGLKNIFAAFQDLEKKTEDTWLS